MYYHDYDDDGDDDDDVDDDDDEEDPSWSSICNTSWMPRFQMPQDALDGRRWRTVTWRDGRFRFLGDPGGWKKRWLNCGKRLGVCYLVANYPRLVSGL